MSQQELAARAGVSQRHVSFLESGRSRPTAEMLERLAGCLDVPPADRNTLLAAAGFTPAHRDLGRGDGDRAALHAALAIVLEKHAPYPALVLDRCWNVRLANAPAARLLEALAGPRRPANALELACGPLARLAIENWTDVARMMLARVRRELAQTAADDLRELLLRLERDPAVKALSEGEPEHDAGVSALPVFPARLRAGELAASVFTVVAGVGTAQDAALDDLRLELYYPADEATGVLMERFASGALDRLLPPR
jgi:transcriptional regulator with XRE-family HTH domain